MPGAFFVGFVVDTVAPRLVILYLQRCSAVDTIHTNTQYFHPLLDGCTVGPLVHLVSETRSHCFMGIVK